MICELIETWNKFGHPHRDFYQFVLDHGREMTPVERIGRKMRNGLCFMNSAHTCDRLGLDHRYVEGLAIRKGSPILVHHAWVELPDGTVFDPTWPDDPHLNCEYYGIAIDNHLRYAETVRIGYYNLLILSDGNMNIEFMEQIRCSSIPNQPSPPTSTLCS